MGFKALFDRENVLSILKETLEKYYTQRTGEKVIIEYSNKIKPESFVLVPKLGMVMRPFPCKEICKHYYDAYNIRDSIVKNIGAKLMVFVATHSKRLLALSQYLNVIPSDTVGNKTIFSICNRTIRIFDYNTGNTVSIQKSGFSDKYFKQHLMFRINNAYDFIPPMLSYGDNWFEEKILSGVMLARLTDEREYNRAIECALKDMSLIAENTLQNLDAKLYLHDLVNYINDGLRKAFDNKGISSFDFAEQYISFLETQASSIDGLIPTVVSHGDLQGGNILVAPDKVWIIDWETNERRSAWFDAITLQFATRYHGGIMQLTKVCMEDDAIQKMMRVYKCEFDPKKIIVIFLLEDIKFYMEDMLELPGSAGRISFDNYMQEINEINWKEFFSASS